MSPTNIFAPASTPADSIFGLSIFVLLNVAAIFVVVFALLTYVVVRFRNKHGADRSEPAQIYGSNQVELAWTVIPVLIVLALFLAAARVISIGPESAATNCCTAGDRYRPPVLVGIPISWAEYRHCE
jgi:cytochrome c oxidase subunit 2